MVTRGGTWSMQPSVPLQAGVCSTQISWSVWASGWQLSQENVPVVDASASLNAMRPAFTVACVGSSSVTVAVTLGLERVVKSTRETVLPTAFSTQADSGAPSESETSATPRGAAPTATRPSTAPDSASKVKSLSEPAAVTTSVASSALTWIPNGVASAIPAAGCAGGNGSRSWNSGLEQAFGQSTCVIWFRKARFSISGKPSPCVPARPLASLRASAWAT